MQKWEYLSLTTTSNLSFGGLGCGTFLWNGQKKTKVCGADENEVVDVLNQLGLQGWELVNSTYEVTPMAGVFRSYVLKKPLP